MSTFAGKGDVKVLRVEVGRAYHTEGGGIEIDCWAVLRLNILGRETTHRNRLYTSASPEVVANHKVGLGDARAELIERCKACGWEVVEIEP